MKTSANVSLNRAVLVHFIQFSSFTAHDGENGKGLNRFKFPSDIFKKCPMFKNGWLAFPGKKNEFYFIVSINEKCCWS